MSKPDWEVAWERDYPICARAATREDERGNPKYAFHAADARQAFEAGYLAAQSTQEAAIRAAKAAVLAELRAGMVAQLKGKGLSISLADALALAFDEAEAKYADKAGETG